MAGETQQKSGTTSVSEWVERDYLNYESIGQLQDAWTDKLAKVLLSRWQAFKGISESEVLRAVNDEKTRASFVESYKKLSTALGAPAKPYALNQAWEKLQQDAIVRYRALQIRASAPPLPEQKPPVAPDEEEIIIEGVEIIPDELPDALKPEKWTAWRATPLNNDTIGKLNYEFGHALARELPRLSDEQVQEVRRLYESIVGDMYETTYPGDRERIEQALESYWRMLLESTRLIAPVQQPSK